MVGVRGRASDVVNHGRLGPKGLYGSTPWASSPDRLTRPLVREGGRLVETDWETAMGRIVEVSKRAAGGEGPADATASTPAGSCSSRSTTPSRVIGKAGLGTPHMDGNTRLCTATCAAAFKESFGADGQPGSYTDIEHCDAIFLYGHNMPETQTVLWARVLDRTRGERPAADRVRRPAADDGGARGRAHRRGAPRARGSGTNLALMNGLTRELFAHGWVDDDWVAAHTLGVDELRATVEPYTPEQRGRDLRRRGRRRTPGRAHLRRERGRALHRAAGVLPVPPGHRRLRGRAQPAPAARA